jgi:DNA-binding XRE family transcriptional regulator
MTRKEFIRKVEEKIKIIRAEYNYTQDKMAEILGMSKKTLVQIEKERSSLGWSGAVTFCTIFKNSEILKMTFGGDPIDVILILAFETYEKEYDPTMGGKIWWNNIKDTGDYRIQQNMISKHYRILDKNNSRILSSYDLNYIEKRLDELI